MILYFDITDSAWLDIDIAGEKVVVQSCKIYANHVLAVCLNESFHALLADDLIFNAIPAVTSAII